MQFVLTDGAVVFSATRVVLQVDGSVGRTEAAGRAAVRIAFRAQSVARFHAAARLVHVISRALGAVVCGAVVHSSALAVVEADGSAAGAVAAAGALVAVADESFVVVTGVFAVAVEVLLVLLASCQ